MAFVHIDGDVLIELFFLCVFTLSSDQVSLQTEAALKDPIQ